MKILSRFISIAGVVLQFCILLCAGGMKQPTMQSASPREDNLKRFLQGYEKSRVSDAERSTRYAVAFVDLDDDGIQEAIVYLLSPRWCGSGGCSCLILKPYGESFKVITRTTVTQLPIRMLSDKTKGWHDLAVGVGGGGGEGLQGYDARLRFNGKKYPSNPTVSPAQKLPKNVDGKVLVPSSTQGTPLYGH